MSDKQTTPAESQAQARDGSSGQQTSWGIPSGLASGEMLRTGLKELPESCITGLTEDDIETAGVLDAIIGTSISPSMMDRHAALMTDPRFSRRANAEQSARLVNRIQRNYGNRYVQQVVSLVRVGSTSTIDQPTLHRDREEEEHEATALPEESRAPESEEETPAETVSDDDLRRLLGEERLRAACEQNPRHSNRLGFLSPPGRGFLRRVPGWEDYRPGSEEFALAVARYQHENGLEVDGQMGPDTWRHFVSTHNELDFDPDELEARWATSREIHERVTVRWHRDADQFCQQAGRAIIQRAIQPLELAETVRYSLEAQVESQLWEMHESLAGDPRLLIEGRQFEILVSGTVQIANRVITLTPDLPERPRRPEPASEEERTPPPEAVEATTEGGEEPEPTAAQETAEWLASGLETLGNWTSARWLWNPINEQMAEWEAELDRIGEQGAPEGTGGDIIIVPVAMLFTILQTIVGTLDLIARLNPWNVALRLQATQIRTISGQYSRDDLMRDASELGGEALDIITLGIGRAIDHIREGIREGNAFRITQAVSEFVLAALALIGIGRGIRARLGARGAGAAGAAEGARTTGAPESARPSAPTEPAPGFAERPTEPGRGFGERPTEPGRGFGERPTEPGPEFGERPTEPGRGFGERPTEPGPEFGERPTEPGRGAGERPAGRRRVSEGAPGARRIQHAIYDEATARLLRDQYYRGERPGGVSADVTGETMAAEWRRMEGSAGGEPPPAWIEADGTFRYDVNRLGWPSGEVIAEHARVMSEGPAQPGRGGVGERPAEPARGPEGPAQAEVSPTAPTEEAGAPAAPRMAAIAERAPDGGPGIIEDVATAQRIRDQILHGEIEGRCQGNTSGTLMQMEWEAEGRTGTAPPAWWETNGVFRYDMSRVGWPSEELWSAHLRRLREGAGRPAAAAEPAPIRLGIRRVIEDPAQVRAEIEIAERNRSGVDRKPNARRMQQAWEMCGGEGEAPLAFIDSEGVLVVNMEALE